MSKRLCQEARIEPPESTAKPGETVFVLPDASRPGFMEGMGRMGEELCGLAQGLSSTVGPEPAAPEESSELLQDPILRVTKLKDIRRKP